MRHLGSVATAAAVTVLVSNLFLLAGPVEPAGASCAPPRGVADAIGRSDVVVVGTVTATRSRDRIATIRVEERWNGDVGGAFEVYGGPAQDDAATSVDRTYTVGTRYLLFASEPAAHASPGTFGGRYEDNDCSPTQPWNESLSALRPATATIITTPAAPLASTPPQATSASDHTTRRWLLATVLAVATIAAAAMTLSRVRRRRAPKVT